jgi:hypothetical protein
MTQDEKGRGLGRKKPKDFEFEYLNCSVLKGQMFQGEYDDPCILIGHEDLPIKEARRLAKWLIKAADYLEATEK